MDVNFFRIFEVPILAGRGFEPADIASADAGPASKMRARPKAERSWSTSRSPNRFSAATPSAAASAMSTGAEMRWRKNGVRALVRDRRYRQ